MRGLLAGIWFFLLALGGVAHAAPAKAAEPCYVHYWPAIVWRGEIPGGPLGTSYYQSTTKLPQISDLIEAHLGDEAELALIRTIDFSGITGSRPVEFVLEKAPLEKPSKVKAGGPLRAPESDCYIEILNVGSIYQADAIWGVSFVSSARFRYFEKGATPVLWKNPGNSTHIKHALARTGAPDVSLAEDIKDAFQVNMRANLAAFTAALNQKRSQH